MKDDDDDKLQSVKKILEEEYIPSPFETKEQFINKKLQGALDATPILIDRLFEGVLLFSMMETESSGIKDLLKNL